MQTVVHIISHVGQSPGARDTPGSDDDCDVFRVPDPCECAAHELDELVEVVAVLVGVVRHCDHLADR